MLPLHPGLLRNSCPSLLESMELTTYVGTLDELPMLLVVLVLAVSVYLASELDLVADPRHEDPQYRDYSDESIAYISRGPPKPGPGRGGYFLER